MAPRRRTNLPVVANANDAVRGPASAMTAFLREQGIVAPPRGYGRIPPLPTALPAVTVAEEEEGEQEENENEIPAIESIPTSVTLVLDSTNTNAVASGSGTTSAQKRKVAASTTATEAAKKKKKAEGEAESIGPAKPGRYDSRAIGAIEKCGECGRRFTVTKYTSANPLGGGGVLCGACSTEGFGTIAKAKVPKAPVKKRAVKRVEERERRQIPSLQSICVSIIGKHIGEIDAFGEIGSMNLDRICKIVCKHRALTPQNLELFLDIGHTELSLYDCTNIKDTDLASLSVFCPRLERLRLNMCGRLDDSVLKEWSKGFKELKYLSLYGPYLVTFKQWKEYLSNFGDEHQLEGFGLRQSARFDDDCIRLLVERNPNLFNLQLSELGRLNDVSLTYLHSLKSLTTLDISRAGVDQGNVLTDDAVVALLEHVGENLVELVLDQNYLLTDRVLVEAVKVHCPRLRSLSLHSLALIQSTGLEALFTDWVNTGLTHLNLHRCTLLENEAIEAVVAHSGHSLIELDLNSVDEIEELTLKVLAKGCKAMRVIDLSFVRSVDDFILKSMLEEMMDLKTVFVHGNNRVTDSFASRPGVSIRGQENCMNVEL